MMKATKMIAGILLLGLISGVAAGQNYSIYKWIDDDGIINYGSRPPDWNAAERTSVLLRGKDSQTLQDRLTAQSELAQAKEVRKQHEAEDKDAATKLAEANAALQAENCQVAQERMAKYEDARRLYRETPDGEREYLSDNEIDEWRAESIRLVNEWCGKS